MPLTLAALAAGRATVRVPLRLDGREETISITYAAQFYTEKVAAQVSEAYSKGVLEGDKLVLSLAKAEWDVLADAESGKVASLLKHLDVLDIAVLDGLADAILDDHRVGKAGLRDSSGTSPNASTTPASTPPTSTGTT